MNLHIEEAVVEDCDFILHANRMIDEASYIESSKLAENVKKDLFEDKKSICLIAKEGDKNVGMILFSKVYWADRGCGVYASQAYVVEEARKQGVFRELMKSVFNYFDDTKFVTCLVAKKNQNMVKCMSKLKFEDEDMLSYVINKEDF